MRRTGEQPADSSAEKRNQLSVAHTSAVGRRCRAWRIVTSAEQKEDLKGNEDGHQAYAETAKIDRKDLVREFIGKAADAPVMSQRQEPAIQKERKTVVVPQVQYIDEIIDVLVVAQRQVPTIQAVQNTEEMPRVQFLDRVVGVPVLMQRQTAYSSAPQERILERIVEETDVIVPHVKEEIIGVAQHGPGSWATGACEESHRGATR